MSHQCRDKQLIRKRFAKKVHVAQTLLREPPAIFHRQLSRQCHDDLVPVTRSFLSKDILTNAHADPPIEKGQPCIDGHSDCGPGFFDQGPDIASQEIDADCPVRVRNLLRCQFLPYSTSLTINIPSTASRAFYSGFWLGMGRGGAYLWEEIGHFGNCSSLMSMIFLAASSKCMS